MTDFVAAGEERGLAGLPAFSLPALSPRTTGIGLAVLASAAVALAICALTPNRPNSPTPGPVELAGQGAAPQAAAFDIARAWDEDRAQLYAATHPEMHRAPANAWSPAGGVSILMATRFPSAVHVATETSAPPAETVAVPLPMPAPLARLTDAKRPAVARRAPAESESEVASLPPQAPEPGYFDFFRKLFANPDHAARAMLAANPKTAVYDIEKRVVYLPNGDKLEAHSGYGQWMDDPDSVDRKSRGVTPPNTYAVSFREKLFHGVRALRLTPVGGGKMYGRDGMLAHSYMLGEDGQSNGCVSVKDYARFLQAYEDGAFKQLIVVRTVDDAAPAQVASVQPGNS